MQLYLDSYGAFLAVRNGMFAVRTRGGGERSFAVRAVQAILLTRSTGLSTDAALLAADNGIPVLIIDADTHFPLAQVHSGRPGSIAAIRKNQAAFARAPAGLAWAAAQLSEKVAAQRRLLAHWGEHPLAPAGLLADIRLADRVLAAMEAELGRAPGAGGPWNAERIDAESGRLRGQEGTASRVYFQQIAKFLAGLPRPAGAASGAFAFEGRQKRPAHDPFNALLNYLYGMLYTAVHLALLKAGLDPYLGVLHADRYGDAPTLVFDAIEPYRPWADAVALQLAADGQLDAEAFEQRDDPIEGLWLSAAGKDRVITAMLAFLEAPVSAGGERQVRRRVLIDQRARELATLLREGRFEN